MNLSFFFAEKDMLPEGSGFSLFGESHLIWMICLSTGIFCLALLFHVGSRRMKTFLLWLSALSSLFWQLAQGLYRLILGIYSVGTLPLHICSLASYLVFLHLLYHPAWLSEILYFPLFIGPWFAIIFPDWTMYPAWSFMSCAGFIVHASIVLYILLQIEAGTIRPSLKNIYAPVLFMTIYAAVLIPFDHHFRVNYGFLASPSPGSPLIWIAAHFGSGIGYYAGYALLVFAIMMIAYVPPEMIKKSGRRK